MILQFLTIQIVHEWNSLLHTLFAPNGQKWRSQERTDLASLAAIDRDCPLNNAAEQETRIPRTRVLMHFGQTYAEQGALSGRLTGSQKPFQGKGETRTLRGVRTRSNKRGR